MEIKALPQQVSLSTEYGNCIWNCKDKRGSIQFARSAKSALGSEWQIVLAIRIGQTLITGGLSVNIYEQGRAKTSAVGRHTSDQVLRNPIWSVL